MPEPAEAPDLAKAEVLIEALPYFQRYAGRTFVVKLWRFTQWETPRRRATLPKDIVLLKAVGINPVVVHGGGPQIGQMLKTAGGGEHLCRWSAGNRRGHRQDRRNGAVGARSTRELVGWIAAAGGKAIGISGKDGGLVTARKVSRTTRDPDSQIEQVVDLGFVGEACHRRYQRDRHSGGRPGMIPVGSRRFAPGEDGGDLQYQRRYHGGPRIAGRAGRGDGLFLLTDVAGVLDGERQAAVRPHPRRYRPFTRGWRDPRRHGAPSSKPALPRYNPDAKRRGGARWGVGHAMLLEFFTAAAGPALWCAHRDVRELRYGVRRINRLIRLARDFTGCVCPRAARENGSQCKDWLYSSISW